MKLFFVFLLSTTLLGCGGSGSNSNPPTEPEDYGVSGITLTDIPAGTFLMGSDTSLSFRYERPVHQVSVQAFKMMTTEVTQAQWQEVMNDNPSYFDECGEGCPVDSVSWEEVQEFITKLNELTGLSYRLPTEAEWEYAARANTTTDYYWGDTIECSQATYGQRAYGVEGECSATTDGTTPVKSYAANDFGLYDVHGNLSEWVKDCWNKNYNDAPDDGSAWLTGSCNVAVYRGGGWFAGAASLHAADRFKESKKVGSQLIGFRLAHDN